MLIIHKLIGPLIGFIFGAFLLLTYIGGAAKGQDQSSWFLIGGLTLIIFSIIGALIMYQVIKGNAAKIAIISLAGIFIAILTYMNIKSVKNELDYTQLEKDRLNVVIERLKKIREAQLAYKETKGEFAKDFNTLIDYLKNGKYPSLKTTGNMDDTLAVQKGLARVDTTWVAVIGNGYIETFPVDSLRYVPYNQNKAEFLLNAGILDISEVTKVPVFEATVVYKEFMDDLWKQYSKISPLADSTVRVGSMTTPSLNGSWSE